MSRIAGNLAQEIARHVDEAGLPAGTPLPERALAERFHVSRSPVRLALRALRQAGVLAEAERGGFCVADPAAARALAATGTVADDAEAGYLAIARDRLAGRIPDRISENALLRRYPLTRPRLQAVLARAAAEGWAERLPGNGWRFLPVLTSAETYRQSYSFRQAIEPAALLEAGFALNRPVIERHLDRQRRLVAGEIADLSAVDLFEVNRGMHEALIECSGNAFFIESLRRVDRLRRLIEYRLQVDRTKARLRCEEHVAILEMVLQGRNPEAAEAMRRHLAALAPLKAGLFPGGDGPAAGRLAVS
ncbi:MAG: GntR family transcriptional regulator [Rhodobacteraceae bacterium]|jgi:DNA-binding GntR family transcriptional regulator|nr:GntR family transcriptional regulator [Paracoccaceae bacterium]